MLYSLILILLLVFESLLHWFTFVLLIVEKGLDRLILEGGWLILIARFLFSIKFKSLLSDISFLFEELPFILLITKGFGISCFCFSLLTKVAVLKLLI